MRGPVSGTRWAEGALEATPLAPAVDAATALEELRAGMAGIEWEAEALKAAESLWRRQKDNWLLRLEGVNFNISVFRSHHGRITVRK